MAELKYNLKKSINVRVPYSLVGVILEFSYCCSILTLLIVISQLKKQY